ncbi:MAG: ribosomal L7Ae/L30e/S12e/Gadd45 family protein [Nanoarchaeota archaeon]
MAKKKQVEDPVYAEIRKSIEADTVLLGTKQTLKGLRADGVSRVFMTRNAPVYVKEDIKHYCQMADVELEQLSIDNKELGMVCKKPFLVSVLSIKK